MATEDLALMLGRVEGKIDSFAAITQDLVKHKDDQENRLRYLETRYTRLGVYAAIIAFLVSITAPQLIQQYLIIPVAEANYVAE